MPISDRIQSYLAVLALVFSLFVTTPTLLQAQTSPAVPAASESPTVKDFPLAAEEREGFVGLYSVTTADAEKPPLSLRIFEQEDRLMGALNGNDPTRMLYQGNNVFRPEAAVVFVLTFTVEGERATRLSIMSPDGPMDGVRVAQEEMEGDSTQPASPTSGALYDELARMDSVLFDASFVSCDREKWKSLLTADIEFYHDRGGFTSGQAVKPPERCPRDQGITRELVDGSLEVYPIKDYGAVQRGVHRFIEEGVPTSTVAQFVHLWQKKDGVWKIARVLSFDHQSETSASSNR
jgi:hypothetical protein